MILALSRAILGTAPLITIGALTYVPFAPDGIWSPFTVLQIQVFNWVSRPQEAFLTFCSHLAMRGTPATAIQELAGDADPAMTQCYAPQSGRI